MWETKNQRNQVNQEKSAVVFIKVLFITKGHEKLNWITFIVVIFYFLYIFGTNVMD